MKMNVGSVDRILRIVIGIAAIGLGIGFQSWWGIIGIVPLLTAGLNFCPLYAMLGMSTIKK